MRPLYLIIGLVSIFILAGIAVWLFRGGVGSIKDLPLPIFGLPSDEGSGVTPPDDALQPGKTPPQSGNGSEQAIRLKQIFPDPISGFAILERPVFFGTRISTTTGQTVPIIATTTVVRFMEQETGHVFEHVLSSGQTRRLTNTTIPRSHDATFSLDGSHVVVRYSNERSVIETFAGVIKENTDGTPGTLSGEFLEESVNALVSSPSENKIFYLTTVGGESVGTLADANGKNKRQIFKFSFTEWLVDWGTRASILVSTKPSGLVAGYVYEINQQTGILSKITGGLLGLTVKGDTRGERLLLGSGGSRARISLYTRATGVRQELSLETLPEKCAWAPLGLTVYCAIPENIPMGLYPDDWYRGTVSFRDAFWKIRAENGSSDFILSLSETSGKEIDAVSPSIDINERRLLFMNKNDGSLWGYELEKE